VLRSQSNRFALKVAFSPYEMTLEHLNVADGDSGESKRFGQYFTHETSLLLERTHSKKLRLIKN
jgi:hypothetical protein